MDSAIPNRDDASVAFDRGAIAAAPAEWDQLAGIPRPTLPKSPGASQNYRRWGVRAAAFTSFLAVLVVGLHAAITFGLRRIDTSAFGATNRLMSGRINAQIVITGSSRALVHYDPRIIEAATGFTTYNLGRNGSQTDLQLAVLKTYLAHNAKPRLVVHNLDLYSCVTSHEIYDPTQYVPYLSEEAIYSAVTRVYPDAWKWRYVPLYGYVVPDMRLTWMLGLKRLAGFEPQEDHFNGFEPRQLGWTGDFEKFRQDHPQGVNITVEPQGVRDLEELITVCRDNAIPLMLVYSPEYFEIQPLEKNRRAIFALFARLCARNGISLWDYSDSDISHRREYFYNSQHLNADGATAFSIEFGRRLATAGSVAALRAGPE